MMRLRLDVIGGVFEGFWILEVNCIVGGISLWAFWRG